MDLTLHLGAHRTANTSLQRYMRGQHDALEAAGVEVWTGTTTRDGRLAGLLGDPGNPSPRREILAQRSGNRVRVYQETLRGAGVSHLVIAEQSLLGSLRENHGLARLYPTAPRRLARVAQALPHVGQITLAVRSYDTFWASCIGYMTERGAPMPDKDHLDHFVTQPRRWRHIIEETAEIFPQARVTVWCFERLANVPEVPARQITGVGLRAVDSMIHLNKAAGPDALQARLREAGENPLLVRADAGVFAPFDADQRRTLRDLYAEDVAWLRAGADGLANYIDLAAETCVAHLSDREGRPYDRSHKAVERTGHQGAEGQTP